MGREAPSPKTQKTQELAKTNHRREGLGSLYCVLSAGSRTWRTNHLQLSKQARPNQIVTSFKGDASEGEKIKKGRGAWERKNYWSGRKTG